jgi:hypothetical protein
MTDKVYNAGNICFAAASLALWLVRICLTSLELKTIIPIGKNPIMTQPVTSSQNHINGGSGGARTRNLCRDRAAL